HAKQEEHDAQFSEPGKESGRMNPAENAGSNQDPGENLPHDARQPQTFEDLVQQLRRAENHQHPQRKPELFRARRYNERSQPRHPLMRPDALSLFNPAGQQHSWTAWLRKSLPSDVAVRLLW